MKPSRILAVCFLFVFSAGGLAPATARADEPASFDYFYNALQPYGQWVEIAGYGYCWQPAGVDENWQPYSDGYWVYTDAGWTWVSYEEYGFITYHYGRWTRVEDFGWVWVPGYEWAPAWVSWREGDDYIGWAPLPPECRFDADAGIDASVDATYDIGPGYYNFCRVSDFGAPALQPVIIDRRRNVTIIINTLNITNITIYNRIVFNCGPNFEIISRRVGRPIQVLRLERHTGPFAFHGGREGFARPDGNRLIVMAPLIAPPSSRQIAPPKVAKVIPNARMDRGWAHVSDPNVRQQIQTKIKSQTGGISPGKPHARPVTQEQLQMIPKADGPASGGPAITTPGSTIAPQPSATPVQGSNSPVRRRDPLPPVATPVPGNTGPATSTPPERRHRPDSTQAPVAPPANPAPTVNPPIRHNDPVIPSSPGRQNGPAAGVQAQPPASGDTVTKGRQPQQPAADSGADAARAQQAEAARQQQQRAEAAARAQQQAEAARQQEIQQRQQAEAAKAQQQAEAAARQREMQQRQQAEAARAQQQAAEAANARRQQQAAEAEARQQQIQQQRAAQQQQQPQPQAPAHQPQSAPAEAARGGNPAASSSPAR